VEIHVERRGIAAMVAKMYVIQDHVVHVQSLLILKAVDVVKR
jgi:hypothetical protein